ncbi:MAG TPA: Uma2 family endonuclease [Bryobacteraceae bacterium]|jgi:Uma2 family endonuclease|nr:Uma2 family endonuclease [Bryobacteraceae bacterium]
MAAVADHQSLADFEAKYQHSDRAYEYWYGEAVPKASPTWIHGLLQGILIQLLREAGFAAGSEIELRIAPDARPRPDVIATRKPVAEAYPTSAVEVAVEILSPDDSMSYVLQKCQAYARWGFAYVYVVDPESRQLFRWTASGLELADKLIETPSARIWQLLEESLLGK